MFLLAAGSLLHPGSTSSGPLEADWILCAGSFLGEEMPVKCNKQPSRWNQARWASRLQRGPDAMEGAIQGERGK